MAQVIGSREAQDLNYGPIIPGYKAGDILAFTGRVRNEGSGAATASCFPDRAPRHSRPLISCPAEEALYFTPTYTVTDEDVTRGALKLTFAVEGKYEGLDVRLGRTFQFDMATGGVRIEESSGR